MKLIIVDLLGDCWGFLTGLLEIFCAIVIWMLSVLTLDKLEKSKIFKVNDTLVILLMIVWASLGFVGFIQSILGFYHWENSLYADKIPSKLFFASLVQMAPFFAILFLSKKLDKANLSGSDLGGVMAALFVAFIIVAILGLGGLIISAYWFIVR